MMDNFEEFGNVFKDLQPTSNDEKSLRTAVVSFLRDFPKQIVNMLNEMKAEFVQKCENKMKNWLNYRAKLSFLVTK